MGTVISQDPAAGSTTKLNGRVNIVVSAGPEPAPEPEAPSDSTTGGDWWSGLFGSGSSSSSTETGTEQGTAGSGDSSQKPLTRLVVLAAELTEACMKDISQRASAAFTM